MCNASKCGWVGTVLLAAMLAVASTAQASFVTAGTLYVDLDSTTVASAGDGGTPTTWENGGSLGNFTNSGMTYTANVAGTGWSGVTGQGSGSDTVVGPQTLMTGPTAVADIAGNSDRSIEVWAYNPSVPSAYPSYETMISYGSHNTNADIWFNQGAHGAGSEGNGAGAIVHYGNDWGWGTMPAVGQWNYLVYTYDGAGTDKLYVNGALNRTITTGTIDTSLSTIVLNAVEGIGYNGSMSYRLVRVEGGCLSAGDVADNWTYGRTALTPEPCSCLLLASGMLGVVVYAWKKRK